MRAKNYENWPAVDKLWQKLAGLLFWPTHAVGLFYSLIICRLQQVSVISVEEVYVV